MSIRKEKGNSNNFIITPTFTFTRNSTDSLQEHLT